MKLKIHYKITFIIVVIAVFSLTAAYFYLSESLKTYTYNSIKMNILRENLLLKHYFEKENIPDFDFRSFDSLADKTGEDLGKRVTIINSTGVVLGDSELDGDDLMEVENHYSRPEVQDALDSGIGTIRRFSATLGYDMLYVARPLSIGTTTGIIRLSLPLVEIELISNRLKGMLLVAFFITVLLIVLVSFFVSLLISRPIRDMAWHAKNIARGDFSRKITARSNDEIGDLARSFNHMSEQVKERIEDIVSGKSRLEAVLLSMFEGVMVVDEKGNIQLINQKLKEFFQIADETLNKKPLEVIRNVQIQEIVNKVLQLKKGVFSSEISILLELEKNLLVHATPIIKHGHNEGAVLVFHDITELRRLENIRKDFVANVSHELRTPIASIKGFAETLLEGALADKKNAKDFVQIIYSDSERLARLIDDILDLSKIESGSLDLNLKPYSIASLARNMAAGLNKQAKERSVSIQIDMPQDMPKILADESRISQVLLNLLDNAIKYNKDRGQVKISANEEGQFVRISVSDTGIGIPEKDIPRIFERFYRVDKARSRELGGTGLGLSIVKHIVSSHRGEVKVESLLGKGSTFSFTLPKA